MRALSITVRIFAYAALIALTAWCVALALDEYRLWSAAADIALLAAIPLSSLLHEAGHMLFGAAVKIKATPEFRLFGSSSCEIIPETDKGLKIRVIFTALGGVIVNALFAAAGFVAVFVHAVPLWLCAFMPASVWLIVMNAFPVEYASGKTDGYIVYGLLKNTDETKVMLAVLTVQAQVLNGKRIEEVDEKLLFDLPVIREDDPAFISLTELRYEYFSAKGEEDEAQRYAGRLNSLKEYLPEN